MIEEFVAKINNIIWGTPFLSLFIFLGIYLSIKLKFPQIRTLMSIGKINCNKGKNGQITPFRALMTVLAGTLGIGNITGVASAIVIGGIGSIFWIFVSGFIAMPISYAENYLALKYRRKDKRVGFIRWNNVYIRGSAR